MDYALNCQFCANKFGQRSSLILDEAPVAGEAGDDEARWRSSGEQSCAREDRKQMGKGSVRILTPRRSSGGSLRQ
jgi:hypothetical protein